MTCPESGGVVLTNSLVARRSCRQGIGFSVDGVLESDAAEAIHYVDRGRVEADEGSVEPWGVGGG